MQTMLPDTTSTAHLKYVGIGWSLVVGSSVAQSLLDPAKRHLLLSHRLIHARIVGQWCATCIIIVPLPSTNLL